MYEKRAENAYKHSVLGTTLKDTIICATHCMRVCAFCICSVRSSGPSRKSVDPCCVHARTHSRTHVDLPRTHPHVRSHTRTHAHTMPSSSSSSSSRIVAAAVAVETIGPLIAAAQANSRQASSAQTVDAIGCRSPCISSVFVCACVCLPFFVFVELDLAFGVRAFRVSDCIWGSPKEPCVSA